MSDDKNKNDISESSESQESWECQENESGDCSLETENEYAGECCCCCC